MGIDLGKRFIIALNTILNGTIVPWVLAALLSLVVLTLAVSAKSWRDMKRSPYFFLRRQAEKRLQSYLSIGVVLSVLLTAVALYAWQTPTDTTVRMAILTNTKPPETEVLELIERAPVTEPAIDLMVSADAAAMAGQAFNLDDGDALFASAEPVLPPEFDNFEPLAELRDNTELGTLSFSTEVDEAYQPINARQIFPEGNYMVYATFSYDEMADGMEWAWVWRRNGEVLEGGNELWKYGEDGPGYIYYNPEEGFASGEYTLEVWVNGELLTQGSIIMNSAAVTAGN